MSNNSTPENKMNGENQIPEQVETSIILVDKDGTIVYANTIFCALTGYRFEELLGKNISIIRSPENPQTFYKELRDAILGGKEWKGRILDRKKNGELIELLTTISPIKNKDGEITYFLGIKENICAKKKQAKKLEEMHKLSQLGNISGSLLHELKSHYALIKMNMDQFEPRSKAGKNNYLIIKKDLEKLNRYFQNVLQYLRNREYDMTNVNLHDVIDISYSFVRPLISEKSIQFDNRVASEIIRGDYQQLQAVFKNLIQNSADAIVLEGKIEAWSEKGDRFTKVFFKDNGPGMKNPERAFEPFYSTKSNGSGLGLTISEKIMQKHNGSLKLLKSVKGETIFEINFMERISE